MTRKCALVEAGLRTYMEGLQLQRWAWDKVASGEWDGIFILIQHFPVITLGRTHNSDDLLWSVAEYTSKGIDLIHCNRGGKATCHNPGQLVGYPILNLAKWHQDTHWYMRSIEQIIINTIEFLGIRAERKQGYTGVWTKDRKIAAIGVAIRHWIASHGFALNVNNDLAIFKSVVPCGIREYGVTSLLDEGIGDVSVSEVCKIIICEFQHVLQCYFDSVIPLDINKEPTQSIL